MTSSVIVETGATLTIQSGVTIKIVPGSQLNVQGSLVATGAEFELLQPSSPSASWSGIYVNGSATLVNCDISGAIIGINAYKPSGVVDVSDSFIHDNETGVYTYLTPSSTGSINLEDNDIYENDATGIEVFSTTKITIDDNDIYENGKDGILLTDSYADIMNNRIKKNGTSTNGFGVTCFGSSPMMYCNDFDNDYEGEMALYNQSYPILWDDPGASGGVNTFLNDSKTLITMSESYPIVKKGYSNFYVGSPGLFMADKSKTLRSMISRTITGAPR
jgi:parallel beta-helix repeat protein